MSGVKQRAGHCAVAAIQEGVGQIPSTAAELALISELRDQRDDAVTVKPKCELRCCKRSGSDVSAREREVLILIGQGRPTKQIAALLSVSEATVSEYRKRLCRKLGLHSTGELAACAVGQLSGICRELVPRDGMLHSRRGRWKGSAVTGNPVTDGT